MFNRILVANRGEIAVRIIRACRDMGIETVAVYSEIDKNALHTQLADFAVCIGGSKAADSYLNMHNIITATVNTGAQAIHPGFGFLSENPKFVKMCEECNITFIGPSSAVIESMGNKTNAREMMKKAGVPIVPGTKKNLESIEEAISIAKEIGYPVIAKATNGGGGKGMRIAYNEEELRSGYKTAKMEAKASFGDDDMYLEKFIESPKHIEIQLLADKEGNVIHLGERDCSMQRRNQKVIEEAPSSVVTPELRKKMGDAAISGAKFVNYTNAGTIEFLLDKHGKFYFMEMNTRIQVEHPVTEMITGIDIVREQIRIAYGEPLSMTQEEVRFTGHAIECRINAENPSKNFMPSPGLIKSMNLPGGYGVRNDLAVYAGYTIPPTYDSMIGKLIVHDDTRAGAILKMKRALGEYIIDGVETNIDFQYDLVSSPTFEDGTFDTTFIGSLFDER
ncbi:MAG: acetyl-CoA carboxylase biotin carboxylase subunit [Acidaminobacteraceae bacterium]